MSSSKARRVVRAAAALALSAMATATLTACQGGGSSDRAEGGATSATSPSAPTGTGSSDTSGTGTSTGGGSSSGGKTAGSGSSSDRKTTGSDSSSDGRKTGGPSSPADAAAPKPCSNEDVDFTASPDDRGENTYMLKVTNRTSEACTAFQFPLVTFGSLDKQATALERTRPADPVVLKPGQSAYAAVSGGSTGPTSKKALSIFLTMDTDTARDQVPLEVRAAMDVSPAAIAVTAWQNNREDATGL